MAASARCQHKRLLWGCADCAVALNRQEHHDDPDCWCRPKKRHADLVTETEVWVHRYADD